MGSEPLAPRLPPQLAAANTSPEPPPPSRLPGPATFSPGPLHRTWEPFSSPRTVSPFSYPPTRLLSSSPCCPPLSLAPPPPWTRLQLPWTRTSPRLSWPRPRPSGHAHRPSRGTPLPRSCRPARRSSPGCPSGGGRSPGGAGSSPPTARAPSRAEPRESGSPHFVCGGSAGGRGPRELGQECGGAEGTRDGAWSESALRRHPVGTVPRPTPPRPCPGASPRSGLPSRHPCPPPCSLPGLHLLAGSLPPPPSPGGRADPVTVLTPEGQSGHSTVSIRAAAHPRAPPGTDASRGCRATSQSHVLRPECKAGLWGRSRAPGGAGL